MNRKMYERYNEIFESLENLQSRANDIIEIIELELENYHYLEDKLEDDEKTAATIFREHHEALLPQLRELESCGEFLAQETNELIVRLESLGRHHQ